MRPQLVNGVTVLGNLAVDLIDGAPPTPGGCASFAGVALEFAGGTGQIVAMGAPQDHQLFTGVLDRFGSLVRIIDSDRTAGFSLDYVDVDAVVPNAGIGSPMTARAWSAQTGWDRSPWTGTTRTACFATSAS